MSERGYWERARNAGVSRRALLRTTAVGAGAAFLAACGGSNNNSNNGGAKAPSVQPSTGAASATAAASAIGTAAARATAAGSPAAGTGPLQAPQAQASLKTGGTLQQAFVVANVPLDPYENATYSSQEVAGSVYGRLFRFNSGTDPQITESAQPIPEMAASYEVTPDGLTYSIKLRQGVTWHPPLSRQVTTDDVTQAWMRFTTDVKNVNKDIFAPIVDSLTAPDQQTLVFKLKAPYVPFVNKLANPQLFWVMSADAVNGKIDPSSQIVGTGPWMWGGATPTAYNYKKNPNFYIKGIPYADAFVWNVIPSTATQEAQFQAGSLDILGVPNSDVDTMQKAVPKATQAHYLSTSYLELFFTPMNVPNNPFTDVRLRHAVSLAVDRKSVLDLAYKGQGAWSNSVPPGLGKWWLDPQGTEIGASGQWYKYDPKMAKQLLDASGQTNTEFQFIYPTNAYGDVFNQASDAIRGMLADAGFKVQPVTVDYLKDWINNGQGYFWKGLPPNSIGHVPQSPFTDPDDYLSGLFTPGGLRNDEAIDDQDMAPVIKQQRAELDENKRLALVKQVQQMASDKMWYVPLVTSQVTVMSQPWCLNYYPVNSYAQGDESYAYLALNK